MSAPSGGTARILASRPVRVWIIVCHLGWKVMPRRKDGTLNWGLVHVACALSNIKFKDSDPRWGKEIVRAGYTQIPSIRDGKPHKSNAEIGWTAGRIPDAQRKYNVFTLRRTKRRRWWRRKTHNQNKEVNGFWPVFKRLEKVWLILKRSIYIILQINGLKKKSLNQVYF